MPGDSEPQERMGGPRSMVADAPVTVVGRQAIYNRQPAIVAHELLFRTPGATTAQLGDIAAGAATAEVLVTAFTEVGLDRLVGDHPAFVNIPYQFLVDGFCSALPRERVVLEILEDVPIDRPVIQMLEQLVSDGYQVALDDFELRPDVEALLDLAHIVKVDVLALRGDELAHTLDRLRAYDLKLLAEKVEDRADLSSLAAMGFELFQGYGLERPTVVESRRSDSNRTVVLQLMTELYRSDIEIGDIVEILPRDPQLVIALLRVVNSASLARSNRIVSLHQALVRLGLQGVRNWATMILMTRVADGRPVSLSRALVRAKLAEELAPEAGVDPAGAFTVGLLSALPDLMGGSLPELLATLTLDREVEQALLHHEGRYGTVLSWALAYEEGDGGALSSLRAPASLPTAWLTSMAWARSLEEQLAP